MRLSAKSGPVAGTGVFAHWKTAETIGRDEYNGDKSRLATRFRGYWPLESYGAIKST
jgi:hypothetical protein